MAERPSGTADAAEDPGTAHRAWFRGLPALVFFAVVLAILIKTFLIQAFFIPSPSMVPTLRNGDRILVCRICMHVSDIELGDILVFSDPTPDTGAERGLIAGALHWLGEGVGVAHPEDEDFIKRVGAMPGQTWEIRSGELFVDGEAIDEPFLNTPIDTRSFGPQTVPDGMLLMLGDNRLRSGDSRFSPEEGGLGYVPVDNVIGNAFVIIWPPSRVGGLH